MKKIKILNVFALILNIVILAAVVYSFIFTNSNMLASLKYFTVLSNLLVAFAALFCIPFNVRAIVTGKGYPLPVFVLKLVGTMSVALTFLTVCFFLAPQAGWDLAGQFGNFSFEKIEFFMHLVAPVAAMLCFLFFDTASRKTKLLVNILSIVPGLFYGVFYILNYFLGFTEGAGGTRDWYGFVSVGGSPIFAILIFAGIIVALFVLSILFWLINRGVASVKEEKVEMQEVEKIDVAEVNEEPEEEQVSEPVEEEPSEEPVQEEESEELPKEAEPKEEKKPAPKKEAKKVANSEEKKPAAKKEAPKEEAKPAPKKDEKTKVYHLTKRKEDGMWAITFVGGSKAVKLFRTKKEAEIALEKLTKNQGATALIRNSKGAKAGKFASSIKSSNDKNNK